MKKRFGYVVLFVLLLLFVFNVGSRTYAEGTVTGIVTGGAITGITIDGTAVEDGMTFPSMKTLYYDWPDVEGAVKYGLSTEGYTNEPGWSMYYSDFDGAMPPYRTGMDLCIIAFGESGEVIANSETYHLKLAKPEPAFTITVDSTTVPSTEKLVIHSPRPGRVYYEFIKDMSGMGGSGIMLSENGSEYTYEGEVEYYEFSADMNKRCCWIEDPDGNVSNAIQYEVTDGEAGGESGGESSGIITGITIDGVAIEYGMTICSMKTLHYDWPGVEGAALYGLSTDGYTEHPGWRMMYPGHEGAMPPDRTSMDLCIIAFNENEEVIAQSETYHLILAQPEPAFTISVDSTTVLATENLVIHSPRPGRVYYEFIKGASGMGGSGIMLSENGSEYTYEGEVEYYQYAPEMNERYCWIEDQDGNVSNAIQYTVTSENASHISQITVDGTVIEDGMTISSMKTLEYDWPDIEGAAQYGLSTEGYTEYPGWRMGSSWHEGAMPPDRTSMDLCIIAYNENGEVIDQSETYHLILAKPEPAFTITVDSKAVTVDEKLVIHSPRAGRVYYEFIKDASGMGASAIMLSESGSEYIYEGSVDYYGSSPAMNKRYCWIEDPDGNVSNAILYEVKDKSIDISKAKITAIKAQVYTGKAIKPTVIVKYDGKKLTVGKDYTVTYKNNKKIGKATVTITGKGSYTGKKTVKFDIIPKAVKLSSLTAGKKELTVKWSKGSNITGYEIEYSTSKKFKNSKTVTVSKAATTKTVLKKLSAKKTYYVRIRTYKTVNGKKYYSAWSSAKSKKTK